MSLIKRSDLKNHQSTKTGTSVYPFGLKRRDAGAVAGSNTPDAKVEADVSISPSNPISQEEVPNAQVGGSIGVPADAGKPGKRSW